MPKINYKNHIINFLFSDFIASVSFPQFWQVVATLQVRCSCISLQWLLLSCSPGSRAHRLQQIHLLGSTAPAQKLRLMGLVAPQHVGSLTRQQPTSLALPSGLFTTYPQGSQHIFKYRYYIKIGTNLYVIFYLYYFLFFLNQNKIMLRSSLVVQWLRMCLPMQGAQVPSQVPEDASEQLSPWATTTEPVPQSPGAITTEAHTLQSLCSKTREATARRSPGTAAATRESPLTAKTQHKQKK